MFKKYLFVVEGESTEIEIIKVLVEKLGFIDVQYTQERDNKEVYLNNITNSEIFIMPGKKSEIGPMIKDMDLENADLKSYFKFKSNEYIEIFLIYDVDLASKDTILSAHQKIKNEDEGLLLISNPCFESIVDKCREPFSGEPKKYKTFVNEKLGAALNNKSFLLYFKENIINLLIDEIKRNKIFLNEGDLFVHANVLYEKLNNELYNRRKTKKGNKEVDILKYKIFFNTLYVAVAEILELRKFGVNDSEDYCDILIRKLKKIS